MLSLKISNNLGVSYKSIQQFEDLLTATNYLKTHRDELRKKRWIIVDEVTGYVHLACSIFSEVKDEVTKGASISDDVYLKLYLSQSS